VGDWPAKPAHATICSRPPRKGCAQVCAGRSWRTCPPGAYSAVTGQLAAGSWPGECHGRWSAQHQADILTFSHQDQHVEAFGPCLSGVIKL